MTTTSFSPTWLGVVLSLAILGCRLPDDQVRVTGTVQFVNVEGGCWRVLGADGTSYEPTNLSTAFRIDGLPVTLVLAPAKNAGSYCMVGELVDILSIERR